jgi:non-ribosomal peptide synthetase component F
MTKNLRPAFFATALLVGFGAPAFAADPVSGTTPAPAARAQVATPSVGASTSGSATTTAPRVTGSVQAPARQAAIPATPAHPTGQVTAPRPANGQAAAPVRAHRLDEAPHHHQEHQLHRRRTIKWFEDGVLNASVSCLDRHLEERGDQTAIIWEGDDPGSDAKVTYRDLHARVCRLANAMKALGVKKGDRVTLYLPMIVEAAVAMLACARIGAVHSIVFGGFSPDSLSTRLVDCESVLLITADEGRRGGRKVALKTNADEALKSAPLVKHVIVVKNTGGDVPMQDGRDHWYHDVTEAAPRDCEPEPMNAEDPLFILYTSGSTGKPKGVLHTTAGYLLWVAFTHQHVFDYREGEVYWCTADVGWVTGHSYIVYGPLANGATTVMFEGVPNYPDNSRFWQVVDKHQVNIFYTAPTAIRALMRDGEGPVKKTSRAVPSASSVRSASRSTQKPGSGTTASSARSAARSSIPGGRPRPAAS